MARHRRTLGAATITILVHCFGSVSVYEFYPLFADRPNLITPYESHSAVFAVVRRARQLERAAASAAWCGASKRFMFTPFDRTVVISAADRALLLDLQPALRIDVIPNGIELGALSTA